ncbi:MAG: hypothetical protein ACK53U_06455 [Alphaproteobacteria bacterium]|jgi:hypothetical protein
MPGSQTSKPSWWEKFLGRSPPMPPGGWTQESLRDYWREMIATSPHDAPLSHAALAEFLKTRNTFWEWLCGKGSTRVVNAPPNPDSWFRQRFIVLPSLAAVLVFLLAWLIFAKLPSVLGIYPIMILPEDLLCIRNRPHIFPRHTYRCDSLIAATDLALISSLSVFGLVLVIFLRQGGMVALRDNQPTKMLIRYMPFWGYFLFSVIFLLFLFALFPLILWYYIQDQRVIISSFVCTLLILPGVVAWVLFRLWDAIRAGVVIIFFIITGRFPSWLEDLSP